MTGEIAITKIVLTALLSLIGVVSSAFLPKITIIYALKNINYLKNKIFTSINTQIKLMSIPLGIFITHGNDFFKLWLSNENSTSLFKLSLISMLPMFFISQFNSLYDLFVIRKQISKISVVMLFTSLLNVLLLFILFHLKYRLSEVVVGVSACIGLLRTLFYTIPHYAKYFKLRVSVFYNNCLKFLTTIFIVCSISYAVKSIFLLELNVIYFIISVFFSSCISILINYITLSTKSELKLYYSKYDKYLKR
jgi:O-antigen/teichoic acid export membrane protein